MKINATQIIIVRGSVLEQNADAIVNAANTAMRGGGGVDGAIHHAAGIGLLQELKTVAPNGAKTGEPIVTGGHNLKQKYIIHVAGPVWGEGIADTCEKQLRACYHNALEVAEEKGLESIAFCSISTGIYGYPLERAAPVAVSTVAEYLQSHPQTSLRRVIFAMFGEAEYREFKSALDQARSSST